MNEDIKNITRRKSRRTMTQVIDFNIDEIEKLRAENLKNQSLIPEKIKGINDNKFKLLTLDVRSFIKNQTENNNENTNNNSKDHMDIKNIIKNKNNINLQHKIIENESSTNLDSKLIENENNKDFNTYVYKDICMKNNKSNISKNFSNTNNFFPKKSTILDLEENNRTFKFDSLMDWVHKFEKRDLMPKTKFDYNYKKNKLINSICEDVNEEKNIIEINLEDTIGPKLSENFFIKYDRNLKNMKN